jgi:hypothetical protein
LLEFSQRDFSSNIADQRVLREGATSKSTDGSVETAAAGVVGGGDFVCGVGGAGVEMDADFCSLVDLVEDGRY